MRGSEHCPLKPSPLNLLVVCRFLLQLAVSCVWSNNDGSVMRQTVHSAVRYRNGAPWRSEDNSSKISSGQLRRNINRSGFRLQCQSFQVYSHIVLVSNYSIRRSIFLVVVTKLIYILKEDFDSFHLYQWLLQVILYCVHFCSSVNVLRVIVKWQFFFGGGGG
jgi:hypothetical protein